MNPTAVGDYPLINGLIGTPLLSDFVLPTAPAGLSYGLVNNGTSIDLVVSAVPEPGTMALLGRRIDESAGDCLAATKGRLS